jgi:hypothetical protein
MDGLDSEDEFAFEGGEGSDWYGSEQQCDFGAFDDIFPSEEDVEEEESDFQSGDSNHTVDSFNLRTPCGETCGPSTSIPLPPPCETDATPKASNIKFPLPYLEDEEDGPILSTLTPVRQNSLHVVVEDEDVRNTLSTLTPIQDKTLVTDDSKFGEESPTSIMDFVVNESLKQHDDDSKDDDNSTEVVKACVDRFSSVHISDDEDDALVNESGPSTTMRRSATTCVISSPVAVGGRRKMMITSSLPASPVASGIRSSSFHTLSPIGQLRQSRPGRGR